MLLKGLNLGPHKYEFSSLAVSLALEGKASHRELTSRLLSDLSGKLLSQSDMARAFDKMLKELPDLILDTPEAPQVGHDAEGGKMAIRASEFWLCLFCCCVHNSQRERNLVLNYVFYVSQMLGQFIARAIADHILPMSFLDCYKGKVDCDHAR